MDTLLKKLNYTDQKQIFVLNAPESFESIIQTISSYTEIKTKAGKSDRIDFAIGFASKQSEINDIVNLVAPILSGDAIFWMSYPKSSSKKYKCDFNRDKGWEILGSYNMEPVRQVAIDDDWSALRFRKTDYIKKLVRNQKMALSSEGKRRTNIKSNTPEKTIIAIHSEIHAPVEKVWTLWTRPEHICKWNHASDDWHTTRAENDLRMGGKFLSRMEAKDGSVGFDFEGEYVSIELHKQINYNMSDSRKVWISFESHGNKTIITEAFEAEEVNSAELQKNGWQAILNNFKEYAEAYKDTE